MPKRKTFASVCQTGFIAFILCLLPVFFVTVYQKKWPRKLKIERHLSVPRHLAIFIQTYNHKAFIKEQYASFLEQTYENFHILYLDQGSNDGTIEELLEYEASNALVQVVQGTTVDENEQIYRDAIMGLPDDAILVQISGSEKLTDKEALFVIASAYEEPDVWATCEEPGDSYSVEQVHQRLSSCYAKYVKQIDAHASLHALKNPLFLLEERAEFCRDHVYLLPKALFGHQKT